MAGFKTDSKTLGIVSLFSHHIIYLYIYVSMYVSIYLSTYLSIYAEIEIAIYTGRI